MRWFCWNLIYKAFRIAQIPKELKYFLQAYEIIKEATKYINIKNNSEFCISEWVGIDLPPGLATDG